jgi:hypothetical protein
LHGPPSRVSDTGTVGEGGSFPRKERMATLVVTLMVVKEIALGLAAAVSITKSYRHLRRTFAKKNTRKPRRLPGAMA